MGAPTRFSPISFHRLFQNLFPPTDRVRWIAVMEAYGDGAFFGRRGLFAVAIFLAPVNDWVRFQLRWRRALREADPTLNVFHMTDFVSARRLPYRDWAPEKREALMRRLLAVICDTVAFGCAGVMTPDGYRAMLDLDRERAAEGKPTLGTNAYALCADACIGGVARWLEDTGPSRTVAYIFEAGDEGLPGFRHTVSQIVLRSSVYRREMKVRSITTVSKQEAPALQAADILAYELTHCRADDEADRTARLTALSARIPIAPHYLDADLIRRASERFTDLAIAQLVVEHGLRRKQRKRRSRGQGQ